MSTTASPRKCMSKPTRNPTRGARPFENGPRDLPPEFIKGLGLVGPCAGCNHIRRVDPCQLSNNVATTAHLCKRCQQRLRSKNISITTISA